MTYLDWDDDDDDELDDSDEWNPDEMESTDYDPT